MSKLLTMLAAAALALAAASAAAQPVKIGFVNPFRIEAESAQAKQAIEELKKEFAPRERQIQDAARQLKELGDQLQRDAKTMPEAERLAKEKEFNTRAQRFEQMKVAISEDFEQRRREAVSKVIQEANAVIRQIAEEGKFDLILQEGVFFSKQIDITDDVLKAMEKQSAARGK